MQNFKMAVVEIVASVKEDLRSLYVFSNQNVSI